MWIRLRRILAAVLLPLLLLAAPAAAFADDPQVLPDGTIVPGNSSGSTATTNASSYVKPGEFAAGSKQAMDKITALFSSVMNTAVTISEQIKPEADKFAGGLGVITLVLAAVGIYGVISYAVAQRTREFGIRMALGARRGAVLSLVLGRGLLLTLAGVAIGVVGALGLTRLLSGLLFNVSVTDPATFVAVALLLAATAAAASYIPARRATRVDPLVALRAE